jgi:uncharacterized membrane protein
MRRLGNHSQYVTSMMLTGMMRSAFVACLLVALVPSLSAEPKAKETSTKPTSVPALKSDVAAPTASADKVADPAICVSPSDAQASTAEKSSASSSANASASENDAAAESGEKSSGEFMKDKLKLSLGGKTRPASDEPLQCGVDEAGSQAKESDQASSK